MSKYVCRTCGYVFSAENNEPDYSEIVEEQDPMPEDYVCEVCGAPKKNFEKAEEES